MASSSAFRISVASASPDEAAAVEDDADEVAEADGVGRGARGVDAA